MASKPLRKWFGTWRFWDLLCAWTEGTRWAVGEIFRLADGHKPWAKKRPYVPGFEMLELRWLPTTVRFQSAAYLVAENAGSYAVTVELDASSASTITIDYATSNGSAVAGTDYTSTTGTLTFSPGQTSKTFSVSIIDNNIDEADRYLNLTLSNPTNAKIAGDVTEYSVPTSSSHPVGITQGPDGRLWFTENSGNKVSKLTTTGTFTEYTISVPGIMLGNIAVGPDNYLWLPDGVGTNIGKLSTTGTLTKYMIPGFMNAETGIVAGPDGNLWVTHYSTGTGKIAKVTTTGTFTEYTIATSASNPKGIVVGPDNNLWFTEAGGNKIGRITTGGSITEYTGLTASSSPQYIAVGADNYLWFTESGANKIGKMSTSGAVTEYTIPTASSSPDHICLGPDGNIWFTESSGNKIGRITTAGSVTEYTVPTSSSSPQGIVQGPDGNLWFVENGGNKVAKLNPGRSTATLTIQDDEPSTIGLTTSTYSVHEDVTGNCLTITAQRSGPTGATASVHYSTADGTALHPDDYGLTSGTLTFAVGASTASFTIPIYSDSSVEGNENFTLSLSTPSTGYSLDASVTTGTITIIDDDSGQFKFSTASYSVHEDAAAGYVTVSVERTGPTGATATVHYSSADGSAHVGDDYGLTSGTLTFAVGSSTASFTVPVYSDNIVEGDETVQLSLSSPSVGMALDLATATLTIVDDDSGTFKFSTATYSVNEDVSGGVATISVERTGPTGGSATVHYSTADGTAHQPGDYTLTSGTLTFAAGTSTASFTVPIINDNVVESSETINLSLSTPSSGYTLDSSLNSATLTIVDAEAAPTATNMTVTTTYLEDAASVDLSDIVVSDTDSGEVITATLSLACTTLGRLSATSGNGETYNSSTGVWTAVGSLVSVNAALAAVQFIPLVPDNNLQTTITTHIRDAAGTGPSDGTITLPVTPVNDAPSFVPGTDQEAFAGSGGHTVTGWATSISKGPANESGQTLTFSILSNSNSSLFSTAPAVNVSNGNLTFTPASGVSGMANITVRLHDDGGTSNGGVENCDKTFSIIVNPPVYSNGANLLIRENTVYVDNIGFRRVSGWAVGKSVVSNSNTSLFSLQPAIDSATGDLTFTPARDANGTATISVGTGQSFTITVYAVNTAPSFAKGADQTLTTTTQAQTVSGWASSISKGGSDESGDTLTFHVSSDNAGMFSSGPAVSTSTGNLTFTLASGATGMANVSVWLSDDGGTTHDTTSASLTRTFRIVANPSSYTSKTYTYTGAGGTPPGTSLSWNDPGNWDDGSGNHQVPGINDTARFDNTSPPPLITGNISVGAVVITSGYTGLFTIPGAFSANSFSQAGGTVDGSGTLTVGTFAWTGGKQAGSGLTDVTDTLTMGADDITIELKDTRILRNEGTGSWTGSTTLAHQGTLSGSVGVPGFENYKSFTVTGYGLMDGVRLVNEPYALFTKSGTRSFSFLGAGMFENYGGTISVAAGTLSLGGTLCKSDISVSSGATLQVIGVISLNATSSMSGGGTIEVLAGSLIVGGTYSLSGTTTVDGGVAEFDSIDSTSTLDLSDGTVNGSGVITAATMTWSDGDMTGSGSTVVTGSLGISGNATRTDTRILRSQGSASWQDHGTISGNDSAPLFNTGSFTMTGTATLDGMPFKNSLATATLTLNETGSSDTFNLQAMLENDGTVTVSKGILNWTLGGGSNDGAFVVSSPGTLKINGGTAVLTTSSSITGAGKAEFSAGIMTFSGYVGGGSAYTVATTVIDGGEAQFNTAAGSTTTTLSSGSITGSATYTVGTTMTWSGGDMGGSGTTLIPNTKNLYITTTASRNLLNTRVLRNQGIATMASGASIHGGVMLVKIDNFGSFTFEGSGTLTDVRVFNEVGGTFLKQGSGTFTDASPMFDNWGTVNVQDGTLHLDIGFNPGQLIVANGKTLIYNAKTYNRISSPDLTARGGYTFKNGPDTQVVATYTDPDGLFSATIDWGDGTTTAASITSASGVYSVLGGHSYATGSNCTISVIIGDDAGSRKVLVHSWAIVPDANDDTVTTPEDTAATITTSASGTLLNNDGPGLTVIGWTMPSHGDLGLSGANLLYTPTLNYNGSDSFVYTVTDGAGAIATATVHITVTPVDDDPVAQKDTYETNKDTNINMRVLANDVDVDGDALTITTVNYTGVSVGTPFQLPSLATVTLQSNGSIDYVPKPGSTYSDTFTYTISDGAGPTSTANVTVYVRDGQWATVDLGQSSDWNYDPYAWIPIQALGPPNTFAYGDIETAWAPTPEDPPAPSPSAPPPPPPADEWVQLGFATADNADGLLIRETYGNGFVTGIDLIYGTSTTYVPVTDSSASGGPVDLIVPFATTMVQSVKIYVSTGAHKDEWEEIDAVKLLDLTASTTTSAAPTATNDTYTLTEDPTTPATIDVLTNDSTVAPYVFSITTQPAHGVAYIDVNGYPENPSYGRIVYTPDPDYFGSDSLSYTITDIFGQTSTAAVSLTVTPVDDAPVVEDINDNAYKGTPLAINALSHASDVDGDSLTVSVPATSDQGGTLSVSGATITYTPNGTYTGLDSFVYTISDGTVPVTAAVHLTVYDDGMWASSVLAGSSQYDTSDWAAAQALGAPNTFYYGDDATAWAPSSEDGTTESLTLGFASSATATGVIVRETDGGGSVTNIEVRAGGTFTSIWPPSPPSPPTSDPSLPNHLSDFIVRFAAISSVDAVRITLNTNIDTGTWEEIDAVRLLTGAWSSGTTVSTTTVNAAPSAASDWTATDETTPVTIQPLVNDSDPDGDALTVTKVNGYSISVGTPMSLGDGSTVELLAGGKLLYDPGSYVGPESFSYTISDGQGGLATGTVYVDVLDGRWASGFVDASSENPGSSGGSGLDALGSPWSAPSGWSPSDTSSDQTLTLSFAATDHVQGVSILEDGSYGFVKQVDFLEADLTTVASTWSGSDGTTGTASSAFYASYGGSGTTTIGGVRITVDPAKMGTIDAVWLAATDPANHAPTADNASVSTKEDVPVNIDLPALVSDADNDPLHISISTAPAHGTVYIDVATTPNDSSDDYLRYVPYANWYGTDSFSYSVTDLYGETASGLVTVAVSSVNDAPIGTDDVALTTQGTNATLNVLANDSDPDGNTLSVSGVTNGAHGTVSLNTATYAVTYDPTGSYVGPDDFTYTVTDGTKSTVVRVHVQVYEDAVWADSVAGHSYDNDTSAESLGAPDDAAWQPAAENQLDYLSVNFASTVTATAVMIREQGGSIALIQSGSTVLWSGSDPNAGSSGWNDFVLHFTSAHAVGSLKIFLNASSANAIDAVGVLTGTSTDGALSTRGLNAGGQFVVTAWNSDNMAASVDTYAHGTLIQSVANTYTSGKLTTQDTTLHTSTGDQTTRHTYDTDGNLTTETLAYGTGGASTTTYTYTDGKMTSVEDPNNNVTSWDYSDPSELVITDPLSSLTTPILTTKHFDADGRVDWILDRDHRLMTFDYDDTGRLETETWYIGSTVTTTVADTKAWTYDTKGRVHTASNEEGTYTYTYDQQDRVIHVEEPTGVELSFGYDENGYRNLVEDSLGGKEHSVYDASGELLSRVLTQGSTVQRIDQEFDASGRLDKQTRSSNAAGTALIGTTAYTYSVDGQVASIVNKDSSTSLISEFDYTYDLTGQLISKTENQPQIGSNPTFTYDYDAQGQLTGDGTNSYDYDANGNRATGYTTGAGNRLLDDGTWTYHYDNEGNMTVKELQGASLTWSYYYDNGNHLTRVERRTDGTNVDFSETYGYDVYGNRVQTDIDSNGADAGGVTTTKFALDGWNNLKPRPVGNENWDVLADLQDDGSLTTRYLRGNQVDQLLGRIDKSGSTLTPHWYLTDQLGSVRDIQSDGSTWESVSYDSFGNITSSDPPTRGRYGWTGRELDVETGLQFNRARWYDSGTGRWISQDPMGFDAGDSNLYRYVKNKPVADTDPNGLIEVDDNPNDATLKALPNVLAKIEGLINKEILTVQQQHLGAPEAVEKVYKALGFTPGPLPYSNVEVLLLNNLPNNTDRYTILYAQSRFKNIPFKITANPENFDKTPAAFQVSNTFLAAAVKLTMMSPVVNVGTPIGTDKFGHFFEEGYLYYKEFRKAPWLIPAFGLFTEADFVRTVPLAVRETYEDRFQKAIKPFLPTTIQNTFKTPDGGYDFSGVFGWRGSGVASYADLVANSAGFAFYEDLEANWAKVGKGWTFKLSNYVPDVATLNEYANPSAFAPYLIKNNILGPRR